MHHSPSPGFEPGSQSLQQPYATITPRQESSDHLESNQDSEGYSLLRYHYTMARSIYWVLQELNLPSIGFKSIFH